MNLLGCEYIQRAALAEQLGLHERTLYRWEELRGGPPTTRIGGGVYYRLAAVRRWLQSREQAKSKQTPTEEIKLRRPRNLASTKRPTRAAKA
jgi:DNA-binding transcriptional MerR regulator